MGAGSRRQDLVLAVLTALAAAYPSDDVMAGGSCPYFTRQSIEREKDGSVTRLNYYEAGSWVCYQDTMRLCQSSGSWNDKGVCSSYKKAPRSCLLENSKT